MRVETDGYQIDFTDAIDAFKFDETDKTKPAYHGVTALKAVDVIAEFTDMYVFVEIKEYPDSFDILTLKDDKYCNETDCPKRRNHANWLKDYLKYKFRDSFIYRFAENKVNKPICYLCLINFDNALNMQLMENLRRELPAGIPSSRWNRELVQSCQVLNMKRWNNLYPNWPVKKI